MKTSVMALTIAGMLLVTFGRLASAANSTFYTDFASFSAAAGGPR